MKKRVHSWNPLSNLEILFNQPRRSNDYILDLQERSLQLTWLYWLEHVNIYWGSIHTVTCNICIHLVWNIYIWQITTRSIASVLKFCIWIQVFNIWTYTLCMYVCTCYIATYHLVDVISKVLLDWDCGSRCEKCPITFHFNQN